MLMGTRPSQAQRSQDALTIVLAGGMPAIPVSPKIGIDNLEIFSKIGPHDLGLNESV